MEPQSEFNWQQLCNDYMNRIDIPAKSVVDEISSHQNHIRILIAVVNKIEVIPNWQDNAKLRELARQCRDKIKNVTALTAKDYVGKTQEIRNTAKRALGNEATPPEQEAPNQPLKRKPKSPER